MCCGSVNCFLQIQHARAVRRCRVTFRVSSKLSNSEANSLLLFALRPLPTLSGLRSRSSPSSDRQEEVSRLLLFDPASCFRMLDTSSWLFLRTCLPASVSDPSLMSLVVLASTRYACCACVVCLHGKKGCEFVCLWLPRRCP